MAAMRDFTYVLLILRRVYPWPSMLYAHWSRVNIALCRAISVAEIASMLAKACGRMI